MSSIANFKRWVEKSKAHTSPLLIIKTEGMKANSNIRICTGKHLALKQINSLLIIKPGFFIDTALSAWSELPRQLQTEVFSCHVRRGSKLVYKFLAVFQSSQ